MALSFWASEHRVILLLGDLLVISMALLFALWAHSAIFRETVPLGYFPPRLLWWVVLVVLWAAMAPLFDLYNLRIASDVARGWVYAAACALLVAGIYLVIPVISAPLTRSRLAWFLFAFAAVVGEGAWRLGYALLVKNKRLGRRLLIVGAGWAGCSLVEEIAAAGHHMIDVVGFVDDNPALQGQQVAGLPVLGSGADLERLVEEHQVQDVAVAITRSETIASHLMEALVRCWAKGINVMPMPLYCEQITGAIPIQHLGQNLFALISSSRGLGLRLWLAVRSVIDLVAGILGMALTIALFPLIALAIRLDSRGSIFYRQRRVGQGGRVFWLTKFRTMVENAEPNGPVWAEANKEHITRVGKFLRRTRLDELPQFWNLINGTMTLIGPRPERPEIVERLEATVPYFSLRHCVKPGITGWAQVRFRYASSEEDSLRKLCYDLYYIKHRGPILDALICLYTLRTLLRMEGR